MSNPNRRYLIHFTTAMVTYAVVLFVSSWVIETWEITGWLAGALSLAPILPTFYVLHAGITRFRAFDEFQRRIISEAILWSAGIVGFASFAYGFLEGSIDAPRISMIWVLPALLGTYGVTSFVLARRFR